MFVFIDPGSFLAGMVVGLTVGLVIAYLVAVLEEGVLK